MGGGTRGPIREEYRRLFSRSWIYITYYELWWLLVDQQQFFLLLTGFKLWLEFSGHNFDFYFETIVTQSKIGLQWTAWFNLGLKTELF